jgi:glycosyltransferase involved in cell wall biosynthesis
LTRVKPWSMERRPEFFAAIDVFSMPSRTDSFGIVFLEAWANGLPVVAAAAGGVAEVVHHGDDGLLVPFGDLEALSGALATFADNPAVAREFGNRGQRRVAHGYGWDDLYRTLLGRTLSLTNSSGSEGLGSTPNGHASRSRRWIVSEHRGHRPAGSSPAARRP